MAGENIILNGVKYSYSIKFINDTYTYDLPRDLLIEIELQESIMNWGYKGYISYRNNYEELERLRSSESKNTEYFQFKMDGTDGLYISLIPIEETNSSQQNKNVNLFGEYIHGLHIQGIIYDTEEPSMSSIDNKIRKLYFWDIRYALAKNLNARVSCGEYLSINNKSGIDKLNNEDKKVLSGDLLKYICTNKLNSSVNSDWESGVNSIFYTSPPTNSVADDIDYLTSRVYDVDNYPCEFSYNRVNDEFTLTSYKTLFNNYDKNLREIFQFKDESNPNNNIIRPRFNSNLTYSLGSHSTIKAYKYNKMSGADSIYTVNNRRSTAYDTINKEFNIKCECSSVKETQNSLYELMGNFPKGNTAPIYVINQSKIDGKNTIEASTPEVRCGASDGINSFLMLGDSLYFTCDGFPTRMPGVFMELTSDSDLDGMWEDRFLGTWLMLNVRHIIRDEKYENKILAMKPNASNTLDYLRKVDG